MAVKRIRKLTNTRRRKRTTTTTRKRAAPKRRLPPMKKYEVTATHGSTRERLEVTARTATSARSQAKKYLDKDYEPAAWRMSCKAK